MSGRRSTGGTGAAGRCAGRSPVLHRLVRLHLGSGRVPLSGPRVGDPPVVLVALGRGDGAVHGREDAGLVGEVGTPGAVGVPGAERPAGHRMARWLSAWSTRTIWARTALYCSMVVQASASRCRCSRIACRNMGGLDARRRIFAVASVWVSPPAAWALAAIWA